MLTRGEVRGGQVRSSLGDPIANGYRLGMRTVGGEERIQEVILPWSLGEEGHDEFLTGLLRKLGKRLPSGIVLDLDFRAKAFYHAAERLGLAIPGDISVIGIGNTPWCEAMRPALTSVEMGHDEMARVLTGLMGLEPPRRDVTVRLDPHVVERGSVSPPR